MPTQAAYTGKHICAGAMIDATNFAMIDNPYCFAILAHRLWVAQTANDWAGERIEQGVPRALVTAELLAGMLYGVCVQCVLHLLICVLFFLLRIFSLVRCRMPAY